MPTSNRASVSGILPRAGSWSKTPAGGLSCARGATCRTSLGLWLQTVCSTWGFSQTRVTTSSLMSSLRRSGIGYDAHRFGENRKLVLGGVEIPHARGLEGHSDADVLTHAIADALLG